LPHIDSLRLDEEETARRAARFYDRFDRVVADEAACLSAIRPDVVIGDIPPLAFAAAAAAGVPSVALGNFTWDWIYASYPAFDSLAPRVIPTIERAYGQATAALRLPLHGGFEPMSAVTIDIPLIARRSQRDPAEVRRVLGVSDDRPLVLVSFGAYGVALTAEALRQDGLAIISPDQPPPGLKYQDLIAAADVVVSKPGYGIISECVANDTALLYTSRGRFAEYDVFVQEMPSLLRCRYMSNEELHEGRWEKSIAALLSQPRPAQTARVDGAAVAADYILTTFAR
jgi:L-arabinokinase